jgi:hypothetical protein
VRVSRTLAAEIRQLESARAEAASLDAARQRLVISLAEAAPDGSDMQALARVRGRIAELKARPEGVLDAEMKPVGTATDRGWDTPQASFETQMWARVAGNADGFSDAFGWTGPEVKARIDRFFAALPESVRAQHQTPERMLIPGIDYGPVGVLQSYQVLGQVDYGDSVLVRAWGRFSSGRELPLDMLFKNFNGTWRVPITDQVVGQWLKELDPATGKFRPKK